MASELLKVAIKPACSNVETVLINGVAGHTYTVLSVTICETANAAETFKLYIADDGGATDTNIYCEQPLAAYATFEHTAKFVLEGTDELLFITGNAATVDVIVSYLDQTL